MILHDIGVASQCNRDYRTLKKVTRVFTEAAVQLDKVGSGWIRDTTEARQIHEIVYWTHCTGVRESEVRTAVERVGYDRDEIGRELKRMASRHG